MAIFDTNKISRLLRRIRYSDRMKDENKEEKPKTIKTFFEYVSKFGKKLSSMVDLSKDTLKKETKLDTEGLKKKAIEDIAHQTKLILRDNLEKYANKKISLETLRKNIQSAVKTETLSASIVGVLGFGNLTDNVVEAVRRQLSVQLRFLDGFIEDIRTRDVSQKDITRLASYSGSAYSSSLTALRQSQIDSYYVENAEIEERRYLGSADHCETCVELAGLGWVELGVLPVPGVGTECGNNCRCTIETRYKNFQSTFSSISIDRPQTTNENPIPEG